MKSYFTIHEISELFGIGIDSLRYYERIGLLMPQRGENNYRLYGLHDMYRLNIIADLRKLGFSLAQIKAYMASHCLKSTYVLLKKEKEAMQKEIAALLEKNNLLSMQLNALAKYERAPINKVTISFFEDRYMLDLKSSFLQDAEFDYGLRKLRKKYNISAGILEQATVGASLFTSDIQQNKVEQFRSVFMLQDTSSHSSAKVLPAGKYVCVHYKGSYLQLPKYVSLLEQYATENNLQLDETIYEFYLIDNRYTNIEEEFLTEIQILIVGS